MATVGSLLVNLTAKTAVFDRNLKHSAKNLSAFEKAAWKAANRVAVLSKSMAGLAWKGVKVGFNGLVAILKKVVQGLMAMGAALSYCVYEAMKAEESEELLSTALKNTGHFSEAAFKSLKKFASYLQSVTRSGDDANMELMRLGLSMGLNADETKTATKGALGFADAFGMDTQTAMKATAMGLRGNYTLLGRYIPALQTAQTSTEKTAIFQNAMAASFELSKEKAQKGIGPLVRLANTLGDIAETIGTPFIKQLQASANQLMKWAQENQGRIEIWAKKAAAYAKFAGGAFWDFVLFLQNDFQAGLKVALAGAAALFAAFAKAAVRLGYFIGVALKEGFKRGLARNANTKIGLEVEYKKSTGKDPYTTVITPGGQVNQPTPEFTAYSKANFASMQDRLDSEAINNVFQTGVASVSQIVGDFESMLDKIEKSAPSALAQQWMARKSILDAELAPLGAAAAQPITVAAGREPFGRERWMQYAKSPVQVIDPKTNAILEEIARSLRTKPVGAIGR